MNLTFKEDTHEYFLDGKLLISTTQLMRKHHLAPDYGSVPDAVLKAKAERGTLIHKEIELFNKKNEVGFTAECANFASYIRDNDVEVILSECMVNNDIVAGTIDLILYKEGKYSVADIKTTASLHRDAISWQLSIYAYLFNELHKDTLVNAELGQAYHFSKTGELKVVDIPLKPVKEVEKLFQCEREGKIYEKPTIESIDLTEIATIEAEIKALQDQEKILKDNILKTMENKKLSNLEDNAIKITYVAPMTKTSLDNKKLKEEHPDLIKQYSTTIQTKSSIRITLKGE